MFTITSVNRESPPALAGIKPGDVPVGYKHGMDTGFYGDMAAVIDGQEVTLSVMATAERHRGYEAWRVIRIGGQPVPCK